MIRERWDLPGTALLTGTFSLLLFASANLAAQGFHAASQPSDTSPVAPASPTTPPYAVEADADFDSSAADSDDRPVSQAEKEAEWDKGPDAWKTIIYPIFVWAPVLGADIKLPEIPSGPGGGGGGGGGGGIIPEGTTSGNFNGAAFAGAEVFKSKWSMTANVLYAGMSGDRTSPHVHLGLNIIFGGILVGHQLLLDGLSLEGGFRRMALNINATVLDYPEVSRKPGVWDPLIGATYRRQLSKKWRLIGHYDGGGFGVGCDYDMVEGARADWRFAKHFGLDMGLAALQFKISDTKSVTVDNTVLRKTLTLSQTTWGPQFGFGIYF
jgi:hypothetical protein